MSQFTTNIGRNKYGLYCESLIGGIIYTTMRRYEGNIITSQDRVIKKTGEVAISSPLSAKGINAGVIKPLTKRRLFFIHTRSVDILTARGLSCPACCEPKNDCICLA